MIETIEQLINFYYERENNAIFATCITNRSGVAYDYEKIQPYISLVDDVLKARFRNRKLLREFENIDVDFYKYIEMQGDIVTLINADWYKWAGLIDSTKFDYNPINNYDGVETETIFDARKEKTVDKYDATNQLTSETLGARSDTTSESLGNTKTNSANKTYPYDTAEATLQNSNETTTDAVANSSTSNIGAQTNAVTVTTNSRQDEEDFTTDNELSRTLTKSGNMGVTSTQRLITEQRQVVDFSVAYEIAKAVANCISKGVYYDL